MIIFRPRSLLTRSRLYRSRKYDENELYRSNSFRFQRFERGIDDTGKRANKQVSVFFFSNLHKHEKCSHQLGHMSDFLPIYGFQMFHDYRSMSHYLLIGRRRCRAHRRKQPAIFLEPQKWKLIYFNALVEQKTKAI